MTDYGFKKIFGNEEVMSAFLNDLLEPESPIAHVTFIDKDELGMTKYERGVIYDLRCTCADGSEVIVEMQNRMQLNFSDRIVYYLSRSISAQVKKGNDDWNFHLTPVYGIFFINFHLRGFTPQAIRTIGFKVNETGEVFNDKMKAYTLELTDYRKRKESDCKTPMDYWLYNIANMGTMTTAIPFQSKRPIFKKIGKISELANMTSQEIDKYDRSLDSYRTHLSVMENERKEGREEGEAKGREEGFAEGEAKGRAEGLAEGEAKGRAEGRAEGEAKGRAEGLVEASFAIADKMLANGMPIDAVAEMTGLSVEELKNRRL